MCSRSALEECLSAHNLADLKPLRRDLEKTTAELHCAQASEAHLKAEVARLKAR